MNKEDREKRKKELNKAYREDKIDNILLRLILAAKKATDPKELNKIRKELKTEIMQLYND